MGGRRLQGVNWARTPEALDVLGAGLLGVAIGLVLLSGLITGADPSPLVAGLSLVALAYIAGRASGQFARPAAAAVGGIAVVYVFGSYLLSGGILPLGYENAAASLLMLGAGAVTLSSATSTRRETRLRGVLFAGAVAVVAILLQAAAAAVGVAIITVAALASTRVQRFRPMPLAWLSVATVCTAVLITAILGLARGEPNPAVAIGGQALSERRLDLWHDAVVLAMSHPVVGIGPGRFAIESIQARADPDTAWAHSLPLQQAAEIGLIGALVVMALACWGVLRLAVAGAPGIDTAPAAEGLMVPRLAAVALGVAIWTAFSLAASVDYIANFLVVSAMGSLTLGIATAIAASPGTQRRRRGRW